MIIPTRFSNRINAHLLGNFIQVKGYPLILIIVGRPGTGKTFQLREYLEQIAFTVYSVSSADLESEKAGTPAKLLRDQYVYASASISKGNPSVLLIDDIDTTAGEWEQNTGTVNHQQILSFLMHIADKPTYIEGIGETNRVPVFFTGNNYDRLYEPMKRPGRAMRFDWEPEFEEKIDIVNDIFSLSDKHIAKKLIEAFPTEPISFFSSLYAEEVVNRLESFANNTSFTNLLMNSKYKQAVNDKYIVCVKNINWVQYANDLVSSNKGGGTVG